ncbi:MAG: hypothetical protein KIT45_14135 [Fimbriimonadia bacterium]|nr:hypothetical protein [Fimbriimonadia bacterium]
MKPEKSLSPLETSLAKKLRAYQPEPALSVDQLVELAEQGRKHPRYEEWMQIIALDPYAMDLLQSLQAVERLRPANSLLERASRQLAQWNIAVREQTASEREHPLPAWCLKFIEPLLSPPPVAVVTMRSAPRTAHQQTRFLTPQAGNQSIIELSPVFEWSPVEEAAGYEAHLEIRERTGYRALENALKVEGCRASLTGGHSLLPGRIYRLQVRPLLKFKSGSALKVSDPSIIVFRTLKPSQSRKARWAWEQRTKTPVVAAMILYQMERYQDALQAVEHWNPKEQTSGWAERIRRAAQAREQNPAKLI